MGAVTYVRRKPVGKNIYLYEVAKVKTFDGRWVEQIVRYIGPEDPIYGGRAATNIIDERKKLARKLAERAKAA